MTPELTVRLITVKLKVKGFRPRLVTLATTLLDVEAYPPKLIWHRIGSPPPRQTGPHSLEDRLAIGITCVSLTVGGDRGRSKQLTEWVPIEDAWAHHGQALVKCTEASVCSDPAAITEITQRSLG